MANAFYIQYIVYFHQRFCYFSLYFYIYEQLKSLALHLSRFIRALFYGVSFMIRSISLQWMFGPFMLPCNIYYIGWLIVCLFGWLAELVMLLLLMLFCRCVFSHSCVFIRHDIYKFHICGHIFIHAYVIKSHRICAESLRKYPNTTHIILCITHSQTTHRVRSLTHTRTVITFQI